MFKKTLLFLVFIGISLFTGVFFIFWGSLPKFQGNFYTQDIHHPVRIERDGTGIPMIFADNRKEAAFGIGFLHGQERFFQMDLMRRKAAGELAELFGPTYVNVDKKHRLHQFRKQAEWMYTHLKEEEKELLQAYVLGVNQGLYALLTSPFEYWLLRDSPQKWTEVDSLLVGMGLFLELSDSTGRYALTRGYMEAFLPEDVNRFLFNNGSVWEATLDGSSTPLLGIPDQVHFRYIQEKPKTDSIRHSSPPSLIGSNHWVLSGSRTQNGKSIVACDMHLPLTVPNIWYRTSLHFSDKNGDAIEINGITIPGLPFTIIGSNTHVAWGFTNACVDTTDIVMVTKDPQNSERYLTPEGSRPFLMEEEWIQVKGRPSVSFFVKKTIWGPVIQETFQGKELALKWAAHEKESLNLRLLDLEHCRSVDEAMQVAKEIRLPILNIVIGDQAGNIGWTLVGYIPKRVGYRGSIPVSFTNGQNRWEGPLLSSEIPSMINPKNGALWTANNPTVEAYKKGSLGDGGLSNGVRAWGIQQTLMGLSEVTPERMLNLQLDSKAYFLGRWQKLLLEKLRGVDLDPDLDLMESKFVAYQKAVEEWDGTCSANSVGYRLIREFRAAVIEEISSSLFWPCYAAWNKFENNTFDYEESMWMLACDSRSPFGNQEAFQEKFISIIEKHIQQIPNIETYTWGKSNCLEMKHPLSAGFPWLGAFINMPTVELSGDYCVPRVMSPREGASQRMVVSPGAEQEGIFHMPGGQSGNPLSPHYRDGQEAWLKGEASPFLPGNTTHTLTLHPIGLTIER